MCILFSVFFQYVETLLFWRTTAWLTTSRSKRVRGLLFCFDEKVLTSIQPFFFLCISITCFGRQTQSSSSVQHFYFFFWWCLAAFQRRLALCLLCQRINTKGWLEEEKKNVVPFPFPLFCEICKVLRQELQPGTACRNPVSATAWHCQRCRMLEQYCIRLRRLRRIVHRINLWSQPWRRGALIADHKSASQKL